MKNSKKEQVKAQIVSLLDGASGAVPSRRALQRTIGGSLSTIDRALRELEDERQIVSEWGRGSYVGERAPERGVKTLAVLLPYEQRDVRHLLMGIHEVLGAKDFQLLFFNSNIDCRKQLQRIRKLAVAGEVAGILARPQTVNIQDPEYQRQFEAIRKRSDLPIVFMEQSLSGIDADRITIQNFQSMRELVLQVAMKPEFHQHELVFLGRTDSLVALERQSGFQSAVAQLGRPARCEAMGSVRDVAVLHRLMERKRPCLVFSGAPELSIRLASFIEFATTGCPSDIQGCGVVEEDEADDIGVPFYGIAKPVTALGRNAAHTMWKRLRGMSPTRTAPLGYGVFEAG